MRYVLFLSVGLLMLIAPPASAQKMLIYMDLEQRDHLKAYGVAFQALEQGFTIEWLLNYRGGSFVLDATEDRVRSCRLKGVSYAVISGAELARIFAEIEANNMDRVMLEKAPKIVVYTSPDQRPWDDAVTMALKYAEVPYKTIWDKEVLKGDLNKYDWLHLHHEDFTGQYSKFYSYHRMPWYQQRQATAEALARELGFPTVAEEKKGSRSNHKILRKQWRFSVCHVCGYGNIGGRPGSAKHGYCSA